MYHLTMKYILHVNMCAVHAYMYHKYKCCVVCLFGSLLKIIYYLLFLGGFMEYGCATVCPSVWISAI